MEEAANVVCWGPVEVKNDERFEAAGCVVGCLGFFLLVDQCSSIFLFLGFPRCQCIAVLVSNLSIPAVIDEVGRNG